LCQPQVRSSEEPFAADCGATLALAAAGSGATRDCGGAFSTALDASTEEDGVGEGTLTGAGAGFTCAGGDTEPVLPTSTDAAAGAGAVTGVFSAAGLDVRVRASAFGLS
jgi:hypothetical protein